MKKVVTIWNMKSGKTELSDYKAVIFDIDGVLVETEYFQWQGWVEALKPYGKKLSKTEYFKYAGKTGSIIEQELIRDLKLEVRPRTLLDFKEKLLIEWFHNKPLKLMPHALETIKFFRSKNIPFAAATGSNEDEARLKLEKTGLMEYLDVIAANDHVKRGKPFPDIYIYAAKLLGLSPEACLAFEDTQYGVEAAKAAGLTCFAVPNEFSVNQDFSGADRVLMNLKEAIRDLY